MPYLIYRCYILKNCACHLQLLISTKTMNARTGLHYAILSPHMTLTNIFQIIMFEKTSRCQTAVIFWLLSPIISYVFHLNPNQCGRQHSSDDINSFINLKFYSYSKNRNRKSGDSHEYTTDKSTVYLLSFIKNGQPNPSFVFFISSGSFPPVKRVHK